MNFVVDQIWVFFFCFLCAGQTLFPQGIQKLSKRQKNSFRILKLVVINKAGPYLWLNSKCTSIHPDFQLLFLKQHTQKSCSEQQQHHIRLNSSLPWNNRLNVHCNFFSMDLKVHVCIYMCVCAGISNLCGNQ